MGFSQSRPSPSAARNGRPRAKKEKRSIASIRRVPEPLPHPVEKGPVQFVLPEREKDLRAFVHNTGTTRHRWARRDELIWCALSNPIAFPSASEVESSDPFEERAIRFWPGIVEDIRLKAHAKLKPGVNGNNDVQMSDSNGATSALDAYRPMPNDGSNNDDDDDIPWEVEQSTVYKVSLLAVSSDCLLPDSAILPYQAYAPSSKLLEEIKTVKISVEEYTSRGTDEEINDLRDVIHKCFDKFEPFAVDGDTNADSDSRFKAAAGPFALAIQIASRFANYWTPLDEYKFRFTVPGSPLGQVNGTTPSVPSIEDITGASSNDLPPEELQNLANRVLGLRSKDKENPNAIVQSRYQGLWWGAERIWADDLVRMKHPRYLVAPDGNKFIKKAAGYEPPADPANEASNEGSIDVGAAGRGIFMQIEGIFTVEVEDPNTSEARRECRVCGMLYELADADFVENEDDVETSPQAPAQPTTMQKETETETAPAPTSSTEGLSDAISHMEIDQITTTHTSSVQSLTEVPQNGGDLQNGLEASKKLVTVLADTTTQQLDITDASLGATNSSVHRPYIASLPHGATRYPLPDPPKGYKFRPMLKGRREAVMALELLSGRYYPRILDHPLVTERVAAAVASDQLSQNNALWALECLIPGNHNVMDSHKWKASRHGMLMEAIATAESELTDYWTGGDTQASDNPVDASDAPQQDVFGTVTEISVDNEIPPDTSLSGVL